MPEMLRRLQKKLHWADFVVLAALLAFFGYIWLQIDGKLNYGWRWELIPNYLFRYDD